MMVMRTMMVHDGHDGDDMTMVMMLMNML